MADSIETQVKILGRKVKALDLDLVELKRRSNGTTTANRRSAQLEREHIQLLEQISSLQNRIERIGTNGSEVTANAFEQSFVQLNERVDTLWGDLNTQLEEFSGRVDHIGTRAAEAHDRLDDHRDRLTCIETTVKEVLMTKGIGKLPLLIGLVVAIVTFIVTANNEDTSNWRALGIALGIGAIVAGIADYINDIRVKRVIKKRSTTSGKTAEADTSNMRSSTSDDRTQVVSTPDQTEHTPDLASARS